MTTFLRTSLFAMRACSPSPHRTTWPRTIPSPRTTSTRTSSPTSTPPGGPASRERRRPRHGRRLLPAAPAHFGRGRRAACRSSRRRHLRDRGRVDQVDPGPALGTSERRRHARFPLAALGPPLRPAGGRPVGRATGGRPTARPVNDSCIAACCLVRDLPLATFNAKDFEDFAEDDGLTLALR